MASCLRAPTAEDVEYGALRSRVDSSSSACASSLVVRALWSSLWVVRHAPLALALVCLASFVEGALDVPPSPFYYLAFRLVLAALALVLHLFCTCCERGMEHSLSRICAHSKCYAVLILNNASHQTKILYSYILHTVQYKIKNTVQYS